MCVLKTRVPTFEKQKKAPTITCEKNFKKKKIIVCFVSYLLVGDGKAQFLNDLNLKKKK